MRIRKYGVSGIMHHARTAYKVAGIAPMPSISLQLGATKMQTISATSWPKTQQAMFAVTMEPRSLLGATSARKTLQAIVSVPKPSPANKRPIPKTSRDGAKHMRHVPIIIK